MDFSEVMRKLVRDNYDKTTKATESRGRFEKAKKQYDIHQGLARKHLIMMMDYWAFYHKTCTHFVPARGKDIPETCNNHIKDGKECTFKRCPLKFGGF